MRRSWAGCAGLQERVFGGWGFGFQYVAPGAAEVAAGDGGEHGEHVHDSAARGVDEERAARHLRDGFAVHDVVRLGCERAMGADDVGVAQQFAERFHAGGWNTEMWGVRTLVPCVCVDSY